MFYFPVLSLACVFFLKVRNVFIFTYKSLNNGLCPFKSPKSLLFSFQSLNSSLCFLKFSMSSIFLSIAQQWLVSFSVSNVSFYFLNQLNNGLCVLLKFKSLLFSYKSLNNEALSFSKVSNVFYFPINRSTMACVFF
jgi:hypothetical protein